MRLAHAPAPLIAPRLVLALLPLLALLVTAVGLIVLHQLQETTTRLRTERMAYALFELRRVVEGNLAFGLPLEVTDNLAPIMKSSLDRDLAVLSIDLFDRHGRLLLSTDRFGIGESVPAEWMKAQQVDEDGLWRLTERGAGVIGISVINSFGQRVGGLALRHRLAREEIDGAGDVGSLALILAPLLPLLLAAAWLGFGRALMGMKTVAMVAKAVADGEELPAGATAPLVRRTAGFIIRVKAAEAVMAEAGETLRRLDEEE
jgi:hypothetical protein